MEKEKEIKERIDNKDNAKVERKVRDCKYVKTCSTAIYRCPKNKCWHYVSEAE